MKGKIWFGLFWIMAVSYVVLGVAFVQLPRQVVVEAPPAQYMVVKETCTTCKALEDLILQQPAPQPDPAFGGEYETF
jgi:hypothetical protein